MLLPARLHAVCLTAALPRPSLLLPQANDLLPDIARAAAAPPTPEALAAAEAAAGAGAPGSVCWGGLPARIASEV